uniref:RRM domain-containing protein n=1 Tax=Timema douglasi TaxID=61478 RepID=A0A7R8VGJ1_TIMDO|nr:unnamed protein product [Timema douglasi]
MIHIGAIFILLLLQFQTCYTHSHSKDGTGMPAFSCHDYSFDGDTNSLGLDLLPESGKPFRENHPQCTSLLVFSSLVQHEIRPCGYQRPSAGQPRGYAFVTFVACTDANKARTILDGKLLGCKHVMVRWANTVSKEELERHKPELKIPALAGAQNDKKLSRQTTIQAIEAKLKLMEHGCDDEFKVNNRPAGILYRPPPVIRDSSSTNSRLHRGRQQARPYRRSQRGQRR